MSVKKEYSVGDSVWIYGVGSKNTLTKGKVIKIIDLTDAGYARGDHYIIEIPTHIDPLLEIRTWETISQDNQGPIGALRGIANIHATNKMISQTGYSNANNENHDDEGAGPDPDKIYAALKKGVVDSTHQPLVIKETNPRYNRPKKKNNKNV